jgi:RNA polymerase sigma-70 factor (ECF subfamily)
MTENEERTLLLQAQRGEVDAFGEIIRRYQATVYSVCLRLLGDRSEAEDAAQEAFIRAYERLHTFDAERPFGPWLRRVAANFCFNQLQASSPLAAEWNDEIVHSAAAGLGEDPVQSILRQEAADQMQAALWSLPAQYRLVIELRHFQGLDYETIAAEVGMPLSSVKTHLFRARRMLAERIRHREAEDAELPS